VAIVRLLAAVAPVVALALLLGCSEIGPSLPTDESVAMTLGDVQIAGASGLQRIDMPVSEFSRIAFTGFCGRSITRFAQIGTGRICFSSMRDGGATELYIGRPDGNGLVRITNNASEDEGPDWSPDGSTIAFDTSRDGGWTIYTVKADGTSPTRITTTTTADFEPCWSPDGKQIVFASNRDGNNEIYLMNADGTGQTRLTNDAGSDLYPDWSPDNTSIVFSSMRTGSEAIFRMATDGSNQTVVIDSADPELQPAYSPDGDRIAYVRVTGGHPNIHVCGADGGSDVAVTNDNGENYQPEWSPDGLQIMFRRGATLWVMENDGSNPRPVTTGSTEVNGTLSWSGSTAHVARSLIGAAGTDGGADPPFGTSRPLVIVGLGTRGLAEAATVSIPEIHWGTVSASGLGDTGALLTGVQIEAARVDGVQEDLGRGVTPRYWNTSSGLITKSVVVFFSTGTGEITSVLATTVAAAGSESTARSRARIEGDRLIVRGPFDAVWTSPGENAAPSGASEVEIDAATGQIVSVR
jgi:hypothetical protein